MKKIEIEIKDETAEAIDKVAKAHIYYRRPREQVYGMIIDELVSNTQKIPLQSSCCCNCYVPPHCHLPSWCTHKGKSERKYEEKKR